MIDSEDQTVQKKGAQLSPLTTTLVTPDPKDATATILERDERMAHLCSKKLISLGCGLHSAVRRDKSSPMCWVTEGNRRVNGYGRPFHLLTAKGNKEEETCLPSGAHEIRVKDDRIGS